MTKASLNVTSRMGRAQATRRAVPESGRRPNSARPRGARRGIERWLVGVLAVVLAALGLSALALYGLALTSARTAPLEPPPHRAIGQCISDGCGADQTVNQP